MKCVVCDLIILSEALDFLHKEVHRESPLLHYGLNKLPFALMPRVAEVMEAYHQWQTARRCESEQP